MKGCIGYARVRYDSTGTQVVSFTYDVWGKVLSTSGTLANTIGAANPIRYRGYYYDYETGFYYLQTRYYDPEICRFINADGLISTGQDILGFNMFAYCGNNPVNRFDPNGQAWISFDKLKEYIEDKAQEEKEFCCSLKNGVNSSPNNKVDKPVYGLRDVTREVNNALNPYISTAQEIAFLANCVPYYDIYRYGAFLLLVNHGATWDIKRKNVWENTIRTPFPGLTTPIIYQGIVMTPEDLGNYIYGTLGAAFGIPIDTLIDGSVLAAYIGGSMSNPNGMSDEISDWNYVYLGYMWYCIMRAL